MLCRLSFIAPLSRSSRSPGRQFMTRGFAVAVALTGLTFGAGVTLAQDATGDWPQWGGDPSRNMASLNPMTVPLDIDPGWYVGNTDKIDMATTRRVKWVAKLGSQAYGNVAVAGGRVFIGTNNESREDDRFQGDFSLLYALDEATGERLWQLTVPKLGAGKVSDWEFLGICSAPTVVGDVVYIVTNRCEVLALDVRGMANGNQGPFEEEGQYFIGPGRAAVEVRPTDADILWRYDMRAELGVFPHNITSSSVLHVDGKLYVTTSNGVDWNHVETPAPFAPAVCVLDATTGELLGEESSGISSRILHSNWSSPAAGVVEGEPMIFYGGGDGFMYGFTTDTWRDEDGFDIMREVWRADVNPSHYRVNSDGEPIRYVRPDGPSEIIATPVFHEGRVYVAIGQDPEHGEGMGAMTCIDPTGSGDVTGTHIVWQNTDVHRSMSTAAVKDGRVLVGDFSGYLWRLDAQTGKEIWRHDTGGHIWSSPLLVDGKVLIGNEHGVLTIVKDDDELEVLAEIEFDAPLHASPIVANGVLYVQTMTHLYAITPE